MTARKKWSTRVGGGPYKAHRSKDATYRYVARTAEEFRLGMLDVRVAEVHVYVDEGNGVHLYEIVNLADLTGGA